MLANLLADLDDARWQTREIATKKLKELADMAEPALRAKLAAMPTPEQQRRIDQVLASLGESITDPNKLSNT